MKGFRQVKAQLALKGGPPVRSVPYPAWPVSGEPESELLLQVLRSGVWSFNGPREADFSRRFAEYCGTQEALCVANGSVSLELLLRALDVGPGDEVIVPALTWTATAWAVVQLGAVPIFADVGQADWCLDPADVRRKITDHTKALIPVHLYSQMADMDELLQVARDNELSVIEDCAHAHGSSWNGHGAGSLGAAGSYSFQQSKSLTAGEGGAIVTNDRGLAERVYGLKNCGRPWGPDRAPTFGANYRMTEWQAAVLLAQLDRFPEQLETRTRNLEIFREVIATVPGITPTARKKQVTRQGFYAASIEYDAAKFNGVPRPVLVDAIVAEGIPITVPYQAVYQSSLWQPGRRLIRTPRGLSPERALGLDAQCPVGERIANETGLSIPHQVFLGTEADVLQVAEAFGKVQAHAGELRSQALLSQAKSGARKLLRKLER